MGRHLELARNAIKQCTQTSVTSKIDGITIGQFAVSGLVVQIYSDVLDCKVLFAADNEMVPNPDGLPVYRASELRQLKGYDPDKLRIIHEAKTVSGVWLQANELLIAG